MKVSELTVGMKCVCTYLERQNVEILKIEGRNITCRGRYGEWVLRNAQTDSFVAHGATVMTIAERVRASADPYAMAVAKMAWRDNNHYRVIFHLEDGSTVTFKKVYQLEDDMA